LEAGLVAAATAQHAVISLPQLRALGLSDSAARKRAQRARLHRIHQGVYSLVPKQLLRPYGHWMAAVLACGPGAVLSHRTAAALHELRPTQRVKVDVTVPGRTGRARKGIDVHRSTMLTRADVTIVNGIPCTSVARTLLDLAAVLPRRPVERAFDQAEIMQVLNLRAVDDTLRRNPTHPGVPTVNAILEEHYIGKTPTANELEEAFFAICRRASARIPEVNQWIDLDDGEPPIKADFLWREQRVIVETDGRSVHGTHQAQQRDPRRDQRAILAGWTPIRAPWRQVMSRPAELERVIVRLVGVPRPAPPRAAAG
jgi:hypothetical protein